jgi:haloacetate dehalogenase
LHVRVAIRRSNRFSDPKAASLPGGHFFVDQFPDDVTRTLSDFLTSIAAT